ncbi:MAG: hypothetical protein GX259_07740 [Bacteroidales bacterium]|nr:hypothetical protein [Bacteroidales bacterium]
MAVSKSKTEKETPSKKSVVKKDVKEQKTTKAAVKKEKTQKEDEPVKKAKTSTPKKADTKKETKVEDKKTATKAEKVQEDTKIAPAPEGDLEKSIKQKLIALYSLQVIDTQIDKIRVIRGELPLEVQDLEDDIEGLKTRMENFKNEIATFEKTKTEYQHDIAQSKELIKKYSEQQKNVRNNREYESLAKEIEYQDLEIQLRNKRIKEVDVSIDTKSKQIEELKNTLEFKETNLKEKKGELDEIIIETQKEEEILLKKSKEAQKIIEERYMSAYNRIRKSVRNGLAVVKIERQSCGGCFSSIPPQSQLEIKMHKKVLVCEYCGRILVDDTISKIVESNQ